MRLIHRNALLLSAFYIGICVLALGWADLEVRDASQALIEETAQLIGSEIGNFLNDQFVGELLRGRPEDRRSLLAQLNGAREGSSIVLSLEVVAEDGRVFSSDQFQRIGQQLESANELFGDRPTPRLLEPLPSAEDSTGVFALAIPMASEEGVVGYLRMQLRSERIDTLYERSRRRVLIFAAIALAAISGLGVAMHLSLSRSSQAALYRLESALGESPRATPRGEPLERVAEAAARVSEELDSERSRRTAADQRLDRLEYLLDVGFLLLDRDGNVEFATIRAAEILGVPQGSKVESLWSDLGPSFAELIGKARRTSEAQKGPILLPESNGSRQKLGCRVVPVGADEGVLIELRNLEALAAVEIDLRQAAQLRNLTQVYVGVAHDLRAPLNGIVLNLELVKRFLDQMERDGVEVEESRRRFSLIDKEVARLRRILELLLAQTAPLRDEVEAFDLSEILDEIHDFLEPQARQQKVALTSETPTGIWIEGQRDQIKQAILNIAINGLEALADGGKLKLTLQREADRAIVLISDTGPGIPAEVLDRIFDMHFTTKNSGTGVGLYVSRSIIEAQGGSIEAVMTNAEGTIFSLTLPLATRTQVAAVSAGGISGRPS